MARFDVVVRNGTVIDGSGFGSYRADVGVKDGLIVEVGRLTERGRREIDAEGHVVTPGFIDGHTHMDAQVFWDTGGANSCWHGVTTVVMGNCGFTLAPVRSDARALVVRNLERAEDIDPAALARGIDWSWETFPEYLAAVDRAPKAINYAAQVGHSALRTWAMGERAFEEEANEADLLAMTDQLEESILAGAIGFSTSRSEHHETSDNRPVASRLASWDEVRTLVGVMGRLGTGIFEGGAEGTNSPDPEVRQRAADQMRDLAVETGVTLTGGIIATQEGGHEMLRDDRRHRRGRRAHDRPVPLSGHLGPPLLQDPAALRRPRGMGARAGPAARRPAGGPRRPGDPGPAGGRGHVRRLRALAGHRGHAPQARL